MFIQFWVFNALLYLYNEQEVIKDPMKNVCSIIYLVITIFLNDLYPTNQMRWLFDSDWHSNRLSMW